MDLDTTTNVLLRNDYDLHEKQQTNNQQPNKNGKHKKKKKGFKHKLKVLLIILLVLVGILETGIYLFFKTDLFQEYKELWVQTAMTTMNHQYLATWFLSENEINAIMAKLEVENNENSNLNEIEIEEPEENDENEEIKKENNITVEKVTGKGYVGYVMLIPDCTKVKYVDGRQKNRGSKLSEIVKQNDAIAGINAGGFADPDGNGSGNVLNAPVIMNQKLLYGSKNNVMSLIGLSKKGELILGKYTYDQAIENGVESAVNFGPFIIVNGNNQIKTSNAGGLHPRAAVGQRKDGTMIFVVIDGRQPGYSIGTTLLELQNIFERYDAYNAANLDGGSSATMYYDGKVVNKTSTPMGERYLPNAIIVTK